MYNAVDKYIGDVNVFSTCIVKQEVSLDLWLNASECLAFKKIILRRLIFDAYIGGIRYTKDKSALLDKLAVCSI